MEEHNPEEENGQGMLPAIVDGTIIAIADQAEKRVEAMGRIKRMALRLTNRHDWVDENGKPYLQASGAEKVGRLFGVSWRISEPTFDNEDGGHFMFTYKGEFSLAGATIEAVGTRSSKDGFFKQYRYEGVGDGRKRIELPPSEIDKGDVKKAAYTNLVANGITRLLGIRNLTYDDLKDYAGITKEQIMSVQYAKAGKAPPAQVGKPPIASPDEPITDAQARAIYVLLDKLALKDELERHQKVGAILGLKEVPTSMKKLTKGQASLVIDKLQQEVKSHDSGEGSGSETTED